MVRYEYREVRPGTTLDKVVQALLSARARGEKIYCCFNDVKLHSDMSEDFMYFKVLGHKREKRG